MNCLMCKYGEQMVGFKDQVKKPQVGCHHRVRGIDGYHDHAQELSYSFPCFGSFAWGKRSEGLTKLIRKNDQLWKFTNLILLKVKASRLLKD